MAALDQLNDQQRAAATAAAGPLMIVAGPGTGKTKTITARIVHVLESGQARPQDILALTFTNKAAAEMRSRVAAQLPAGATLPQTTTFHAFGHRLLQTEGKQRVIDEVDRTQLIRELPRPSALSGLPVRELSLLISRAKTAVTSQPDAAVRRLQQTYDEALAAAGMIDFDDLLARAYRQLRAGAGPDFAHVLVDEFQDTSELQYELLRALAATDNICVIGDPNQSIYGFRGAGAAMFDKFRADFPSAQAVALTVNYRSVPQVVHVANAVFPDAPQLQPHRQDAGQVRVVQTLHEYAEAAFIEDEVERGIGGSTMQQAGGEGGQCLRDYAVLYRTHRAAQAVRQRLQASGIPCQIAGEDSPYQQPPVQAIIHLMRAVLDGAVPVPLPRALAQWRASQISVLLADVPPLDNLAVSELALWLAETFALVPELKQADVQQFVGTLVQFGRGEPGVQAALAHIDRIAQDAFYDPTVDAVTLLTIHAAKGLEFNHVFVCAAEDGILPKRRADVPPDIAEERRLFYVAVTRARQRLDILYARRRGGEPATVSPFVMALPDAAVTRMEDPAMAAQEKRQQKRRAKNAQSSLF